MTYLLVTGKLAKNIVSEQAKLCKKKVKVIVLDIPVASLMKPRFISNKVKQYISKDIECIIVPGMVQGDLSIIEKETGIKVVKGPKNAHDISFVLNNFEINKLSKEIPADEFLKLELKRRMDDEIKKIENNCEFLYKEGNYYIENLTFGIDFPVRIIAEIVDAPNLTNEEIKEKTVYYVNSGANVIDIGMISNESKEKEIKRIVKAVKEVTNKPISIDSMNLNEINEAIENKVNIIISLDNSLLDKIKVKENIFYVLIPADIQTSYFPKNPQEKIKLIDEMIKKAKKRGIKNIIIDTILDPPFSSSLVSSIVSYYLLREKYKTIPILIGTGNVTELVDADTPGMNALLLALATELNASFVLSTEVSDKCKGVIKELSITSKMMFISKLKKTYPKGLGIDLLFLRDKKIKDEIKEEEKAKIVYANENLSYKNDPKGWFKIYVERKNKEIIVHHKPKYSSNESDIIIKGKNVENIYRKIAQLGLVSYIDHASYLGSEIQKAYVALKLGKTYIQDFDLFEKK